MYLHDIGICMIYLLAMISLAKLTNTNKANISSMKLFNVLTFSINEQFIKEC